MNFASFKSALGKAYETAASTAATAAKDLQAQVPSCSRLKRAHFTFSMLASRVSKPA